MEAASGCAVPWSAGAQLLDASPDCILVVDRNWHVTWANRRACAMLGGGNNLSGRDFRELLLHSGGGETPYREAFAQSDASTFAVYCAPLGGWVEAHVTQAPDEGFAVWLHGSAQCAPPAGGQAEERARLAARATQDLIFDWDLSTNAIEWNEALVEGFGYCQDDRRSTYDWWLERVHPADRERIDRELSAALENGADRYGCEYRFLRADGRYAELLERGFIVRDACGEAVRAVGAIQDNTGRNEAVRALHEREADLATLCRHATVGILHRRLDGEVVMVNERFCEILGRSEAELRTLDTAAYTHPDDLVWKPAEHNALLANGTPFRTEKRYIRPDGSIVWCEVTVTLVDAIEGRPGSAIIIAQDVSERKATEESLRRSEERLRLIQEASGLADFEVDPAGKIVCSPRFFAQLGLPARTGPLDVAEWIARIHPDDRDRVLAQIEHAMISADSCACEYRIVRADTGEVRWLATRTRLQRDASGALIRTLGAHSDITTRKQAEAAVRESEERFRLAAEAAGLGVMDHDPSTGAIEWSERFRRILGLPAASEPDTAAMLACLHADERGSVVRERAAFLADDTRTRMEVDCRICRPSDQAIRWICASAWKVGSSDGGRRVITTVRDVTDEKTAEERIRWSASHDPLTGLANRAIFHAALDEAIERSARNGEPVGLMLLDLDNFKQINDTIGHDAGDRLLKALARRLTEVMPSGSTVARIGGDEFALVVPGIAGEPGVYVLADAIFTALREPFVDKGRVLDCRTSIGASLYPQHGPSAETLLKNADLALYAAKGAGRCQLALFQPTLAAEATRRRSMVLDAREALEEGRIVPYYQPKLDLRTGGIVGFEALLRCRDQWARVQLPAMIEAAFEDLEVAAAISERMIGTVIADMRGWLDRGLQFGHVAVNAAAAEFRRDNFAERLLEALERADVPVEYLQLEVTETVFLGRGAEYVHRALALLSRHGIKIALDDFGTGYASLRHLKEFPVDLIKIDRSFVRDMEADPGHEAIIRAVVNLGRSLGIAVIAEGIEAHAQAERLIEIGCELGQGFLFSKALPASRVPPLVRRGPRSKARRVAAPLRLVSSRS